MKLENYLDKMSEIKNQIQELSLQKRELENEAYENKLFEVELEELRSEIEKELCRNIVKPKVVASISELWLPAPIKTKAEAKNYIIRHKPCVNIYFRLYDQGPYATHFSKTQIMLDINMQTSDGQNVFDNMILKEPSFDNDLHYSLAIPQNIQNKLLINIDPKSSFMTDLSGKAVCNCVKNKENRKNNEKIKENSEKINKI